MDWCLWGFPDILPPCVPIKQVTVEERFLLPARRHNQYSRSLFSWTTITLKEDWRINDTHTHKLLHMGAASLPLVDWLQRTCMAEQTETTWLLCWVFFYFLEKRGTYYFTILLFYFKDLKWDTGWTLLSQNNPLLFMFSVSFCLKGLLETFSYWLMFKGN